MKTARQAGALYLVFSIIAVIAEYAFPAFLIPGDATATAHNIAAGELAYRMSILTSFVTLTLHLFLAAILYKLFSEVDRRQAMLLVVLVAVGVGTALTNLLIRFVPLTLLNGADNLSAFTKPQLDALSFGALGWQRSGAAVVIAFWGLWLFPFGSLVIKSAYFPRILGYLLMIAGVGYLTTAVTSIIAPGHRQAVGRWMMPLYLGEVPIVFWLLIKGAREPRAEGAAPNP